MKRREFVLGVAGASLLAACARPLKESKNIDNQPVIVVGAGLSGLAAAYELKRLGIPVQVIEQAGFAGGRIQTLRDQFDDGTWFDAGAMSAGAGYENLIRYCNEFSLERVTPPRPEGRADGLVLWDEQEFSLNALRLGDSDWPVSLKNDEVSLAPARLLSHYLRPLAEKIQTIENVMSPKFSDYDGMSLGTYLLKSGASEAALGLVNHTLNYNSLASVSTLSAVRDLLRFMVAPQGPSFHVKDGNGGLIDGFMKRLANVVRFDTQLTSIKDNGNGLQLMVRHKGAFETIPARRVIITLPFTALRKIDFEPGLPRTRKRIIDTLPYTQVAKTFVQTSTKFWAEQNISSVYSNSPYERIFDMSSSVPGSKGMLLNWINGDGLGEFTKLSSKAHGEHVLGWMRKAWPQYANQFGKAVTINWAHSYAEGAYAHFAPGQMQQFVPEIPKPIGGVHFAGEHTQLVEPGMEGALTSGVRAAKEVANVWVS
ncbi:MAG: NAD(P)/FAD-dependent oxidoreductase [Pseudomonadota bacterium]